MFFSTFCGYHVNYVLELFKRKRYIYLSLWRSTVSDKGAEIVSRSIGKQIIKIPALPAGVWRKMESRNNRYRQKYPLAALKIGRKPQLRSMQ